MKVLPMFCIYFINLLNCRSKHKRSVEKKKERNKLKKKKRIEKIKDMRVQTKEEVFEIQETVMDLKRRNSILTRELKKYKKPITAVHIINQQFSRSLYQQYQNKSSNIVKTIKNSPIVFDTRDLLYKQDEIIGSGIFGVVRKCFIKSVHQHCCFKEFSGKTTNAEVMAEAKVMLLLAGHPNFPYIFGVSYPNKILMEFVSDGTHASPTMKDVLEDQNLTLQPWIAVCVELCKAVQYMHDNGVLHNDLHYRNVLLREHRYVKIIDFGKATLITDTVVYNIIPGSEKHRKYNTYHRHLAHELRNVPGSRETVESDVYTLGYNIEKVAQYLKSSRLLCIATKMMVKSPLDRVLLVNVVRQISRILL